MEKKVLHQGDRVELWRDLPDERVPLKAGMLGTVEQYGNDLAVRFDGHDSLSFRRDLDGERVFVVDYCELIETSPAVEISAIPSSANAAEDLAEIVADLRTRLEKANQLIDEQHELLAKQHKLFNQQHKLIMGQGDGAQLAELRHLRYEIQTIIEDIGHFSSDKFLSQALNEGWEILELTHLSVYIGPESGLAFRRVVTLRRQVTEEKTKATGGFVTAGVPYMIGGDNARNERFVMAVDPGQNNGIMGGQWFIIDKDGKAIPSSKPDENGIAYPLDPTSLKPHFTLSPVAEIKLNTPSLKAMADLLFSELDDGEETDGDNGN